MARGICTIRCGRPRSKKYLKDALELTREIQQTGDIFFPKRWADATLSGYQSIQTAAEVRAFINQLPRDYPPRLSGCCCRRRTHCFGRRGY